MGRSYKLDIVFGTRPEAIKLAPLITAFKAHPLFECTVCVTGQHREMLQPILDHFGIVPDIDLRLMQPNQTLAAFTARAVESLDAHFGKRCPDMVLVQGDTTTVLCASLAAFYRKIHIGHVEAGLRTGNMYSPWPEEANRVLTSKIASLHFAPTELCRENLLGEDVPADRIVVSGNTVVDALKLTLSSCNIEAVSIPELPSSLQLGASEARVVLVTGHRRENFGAGLENICAAIRQLAEKFPEVHFVYPVHLNPNVQEPVRRMLGSGGAKSENIHLISPLDYVRFVAMMKRCSFILSDSGGVQEEAPTLGKPVLVMRDTTERPEGVRAGTSRLVGTDCASIVSAASSLLEDNTAYRAMQRAVNPYGDGQAAVRIVNACAKFLESGVAVSK